ncbi:TBP-associated factor 12 [Prunus dulcis]|uniref:TBP-associated factor 12 n=1 Tax=Prunus dulcis TaxID=3755 RepID=A0A4Y1RV90_PRUDU|nr:TBP-associated factor 12 [Prunus dulcis]
MSVRPSVQGMQGMAMMGSLGSSSQMRPAGVSAQHPQRPVQSSFRPPSTASSQSLSSQNFQGHSLLRVSSVGTPSTSPNTSQGLQPHTQPWLSSGSQGKPPIPSPSYRQHMNSPSMQQRSHVQQQQHHPLPTASQQQHHPLPTAPQQQHHPCLQLHSNSTIPCLQLHRNSTIPCLQCHSNSTIPCLQLHSNSTILCLQLHSNSIHHRRSSNNLLRRIRDPSILGNTFNHQGSHKQPPSNYKGPEPGKPEPNTVQSGPQNKTASAETDESCNRILSKRSIHELVNQIDPSEKLDPEVEDILMDIADEFVESITTFSCSLAKHRKSTTLEAKDILLHIEKNWNITLPGFGGDEIKGFRKPLTNDIHKERLSVIKKSIVATETANARSSTGQATGNAKGSLVKAPANVISSQNTKMRELVGHWRR